MNLDNNLSPAAQCYNYVVRTQNVLFSVIEAYMEAAGLTKPEKDKAAQKLYQEIKTHGTTRQSFKTFQEFFKPVAAQVDKDFKTGWDMTPPVVIPPRPVKKKPAKPAPTQQTFKAPQALAKKKKKKQAHKPEKSKHVDDWGVEIKPTADWTNVNLPAWGKSDGQVQRENGYSERSLEEFRQAALEALNAPEDCLSEELRESINEIGELTPRHRRRIVVLERDFGVCKLCLLPIIHYSDFTLDHKIPESKGGDSTLENLQAAHYKCNQHRGDLDLELCKPEMFHLL